MKYTRERLVPGLRGLELLELQHRARYEACMPRARGARVLDLGCGAGYGAARLAEVADAVVAVDVSPEAVTYAKERYARRNLTFAVVDVSGGDAAEAIRGCGTSSFDLVVSFEVVEHLKRPQSLLALAKELLTETGTFVLSTPNVSRSHKGIEATSPFHVTEYDEAQLRALLGSFFSCVRIASQTVHLASIVGNPQREDGERRSVRWPEPLDQEPKYLVGTCADREDGAETDDLTLLTSDVHLTVLQEELAKLRRARRDLERARGEARLVGREPRGAGGGVGRPVGSSHVAARELHYSTFFSDLAVRLIDESAPSSRRARVGVRRGPKGRPAGIFNTVVCDASSATGSPNDALVPRLSRRLRAATKRLFGRSPPGRYRGFDSELGTLVRSPPGGRGEMVIMPTRRSRELARALRSRAAHLRVSVVMATRDRAGVLERAIDSVRSQSYEDWELIVVDDDSGDDTGLRVARLAEEDERIRCLRMDRHVGVSRARCAGVEAATGDVIAYLDSDNEWDEDYLLFTVHALQASGRGCSYAGLRIVDGNSGKCLRYRRALFDHERLLKGNYVDLNVFAHRAEISEELGSFDPELKRWVDWDLILRYTRRHPPAQIPVTLATYYETRGLERISTQEPPIYKTMVLNKHIIDWQHQERRLPERVHGHATIVVLNYRRADLTRQAVQSIVEVGAEAIDFDIVIVDNSRQRSEREALERLAGEHEAVTVLATFENYGFALGCNIGGAAACGEHVVFLNNDTTVTPGWLEALVEPLVREPSIGMTGPKLLYPDDTLQHGGMAFSPRSKVPYHIYKGLPGSSPCLQAPRTFQALSGACLAMRASDFVRLRGFDAGYSNGCEDLDLCFRMRRVLGTSVVCNPASVVYHLEGQSPGRLQHIAANRRRFVARWGADAEADDSRLYAEDGYEVVEYYKPGGEEHGDTAIYHAVIRPVAGAATREHDISRDSLDSASPASDGGASPSGRDIASPSTHVTLPDADPDDGGVPVGLVSIWHARGVSYVAQQLARALDGHGFCAHVLARWESEHFRNRGSVYHPRVINGGEDPSAEDTVAWATERGLRAVIFVEVHPNDWKRVDALREAGVTVLAYEHLDILRLDSLDRYRCLDGFVANGFHTWQSLKAEFPDRPCLLVPWGVDADFVRSSTRRVEPTPDVQFLHIAGWGGIEGRKNTDLLIRCFDRAAPKRSRLRVHTQVPMRTYGRRTAKLARKNPRITVVEGTIDDISVAYRGADMLLWPSKREGLGLPILEALASGIPVLISDGYMMKEWPVVTDHAIVCPAKPDRGHETVERYLPLLAVDEEALVEHLRKLDAEPGIVRGLQDSVRADRGIWLWHWQAPCFAAQLGTLLQDPGRFPADEGAFLPAHVLDFEARRAGSRDSSPDVGPGDDGAGRAASEAAVDGTIAFRSEPPCFAELEE